MAKSPSEEPTMHVVARTPFHLHFDGQATVLSAENKVGQFDILPGHADFFSVLNPGEVTVGTKGQPVTFTIENGILTARGDEVYLFADM